MNLQRQISGNSTFPSPVEPLVVAAVMAVVEVQGHPRVMVVPVEMPVQAGMRERAGAVLISTPY